jgi:hypothetical protein
MEEAFGADAFFEDEQAARSKKTMQIKDSEQNFIESKNIHAKLPK